MTSADRETGNSGLGRLLAQLSSSLSPGLFWAYLGALSAVAFIPATTEAILLVYGLSPKGSRNY